MVSKGRTDRIPEKNYSMSEEQYREKREGISRKGGGGGGKGREKGDREQEQGGWGESNTLTD